MATRAVSRSPTRPRMGERGISLVELLVSMFGLAFIGVIMVTWLVGVTRADNLHLGDDEAMTDLREARELLTKELRRADEITVADPDAVAFWIDADRDDIAGTGEVITWTIDGGGELTRSTDFGTVTWADNVETAASGFSYDASVPADVTRVSFELVVRVDTVAASGTRTVSADVSLRNA